MPKSMKAIDPGDLSPRDVYRLMISAIVPRPIALVSTVSESGSPNVAPFSYFNGVASRPPLISLSIGRSAAGEKDTMRNIRATREFVVNIVDRKLADAAVLTSGAFAADVDEFAVAGLTPLPSDKIRAPRIAESPVHLECIAVQLIESPGGAEATVVLGRVIRFHVARRVLTDGAIDVKALDPLARLGGSFYSFLDEAFAIERPDPAAATSRREATDAG